jgi:hypothetical protein
MRYFSVLFVLALFPSPAVADLSHTRAIDALATDTFSHALQRSAIVRRLVETLESSNVIVHIQTSVHMPAGIGGMTQFVTSRGGYRYLRITLWSELPLRLRTAILGHELQHAVEIATSKADDPRTILWLFVHTGHRSGEYFETGAALAVERSVREELRAGLSPARVAVPGK